MDNCSSIGKQNKPNCWRVFKQAHGWHQTSSTTATNNSNSNSSNRTNPPLQSNRIPQGSSVQHSTLTDCFSARKTICPAGILLYDIPSIERRQHQLQTADRCCRASANVVRCSDPLPGVDRSLCNFIRRVSRRFANCANHRLLFRPRTNPAHWSRTAVNCESAQKGNGYGGGPVLLASCEVLAFNGEVDYLIDFFY